MSEPANTRNRRSNPGIILLVDPDSVSRTRLAELLVEFADGPVVAVSNTREAEQHVRAGRAADSEARVELVLLDLGLWRTGGLQLCEAVREADPTSLIPLVMLVTYDTEHLVDAALTAGATDLLYRPVRPRELAARVHSAIHARREREERAKREHRLTEITRELYNTNRHLERLVCVDPVTGLANRRHLGTILAGEWRRASRTERVLSILMIDLDEFHLYNETYGHPGGDECLRRVSEALAAELRRPSDLLGRYGGEEFVAVLPDTNLDGAAAVAERMRSAVARLDLPHAGSCHGIVSVSIGVASCTPDAETDPERLVASADRAMYKAKRGGRNQVAVTGRPGGSRPATNDPDPRRRAPTGSDRWPAPVWVDPTYADRLPGVLEKMRQSVRRMAKSARGGDLGRVREIADELRALAAEFGLAVVETMVTTLAQDEAAEIENVTEELCWYLDRVPVIYRQRTGEIPQLSRN
jgi:diguanylate cyclase (GGDEF)-like protein